MILQKRIANKKVLLASGSPRRKQLLKGIDIDFEILKQDVDETWPKELSGGEIAEYLSKKKSNAYTSIKADEIIITADTIVWHNNDILNKPTDADDARRMLTELSGSIHDVYTGVCVRTFEKTVSFYDKTTVTLRSLSDEEISYYIEQYKPFDKAGSYGAQDWIGYVAIEKIEGCYYNVMGLPVRKLYQVLMDITD